MKPGINGLLHWLVRAYQVLLGPLLGPRCRFYPSCSSYALQALDTHTTPRALALILNRLRRCHPLNPGGHDPVPPARGHRTDHACGDPAHAD